MRLTEQERALVELWRALGDYQKERGRGHRLLDNPKDADDELVWLELHTDGSGHVKVQPGTPNKDIDVNPSSELRFKAGEWWDLPQAAGKVNAAAVHLRSRLDALEAGNPRFKRRRKPGT